jgi:hypothetical protein
MRARHPDKGCRRDRQCPPNANKEIERGSGKGTVNSRVYKQTLIVCKADGDTKKGRKEEK